MKTRNGLLFPLSNVKPVVKNKNVSLGKRDLLIVVGFLLLLLFFGGKLNLNILLYT